MIIYSPDERIAVMERGEHAKALLSAPFFTEIVDHLTTYHVAGIAACRPGHKADADALAYHHTMQHALTEIVGTLRQFVDAGAQEAHRMTRELAEDGDPIAMAELALDDDFD